jgi:hypothetical protein
LGGGVEWRQSRRNLEAILATVTRYASANFGDRACIYTQFFLPCGRSLDHLAASSLRVCG